MENYYKGTIFSTKYLYDWLEGGSVLSVSGCDEGVIFIYLCIIKSGLFNNTVCTLGCITLNGRNISD
jgi:hypothetical protein